MSNTRFVVRRGYTLIEILLAVTLGLVLMLGVVQMFAQVGNMVTNSQAVMEMDQKVRAAQLALQNDLARYTSRMTPPADPTAAEGYFTIEENSQDATNKDSRVTTLYKGTVTGDTDDVLMFTIHDLDSPFIGRSGTGQSGTGQAGAGQSSAILSADAEVKWHVAQNPDGFYSLYRHVNVLKPATDSNATSTSSGGVKNFSLSDVTFSKNRGKWDEQDNTKDVILDNILMFDVKVWDPSNKDYVNLGSGSSFNSGTTFDTGSRFKMEGNSSTSSASSASPASKSYVVGAIDPSSFDMTNTGYAGIHLPGLQVRVRTFDPTSGIIRDFTVEQEFITH